MPPRRVWCSSPPTSNAFTFNFLPTIQSSSLEDSSMNSMRILVVDDHAPFRRLLSDFLSSHISVVVVGEAADGADAIRKADELSPDLVLMDLAMPGMSGFDATRT